MKIRHLAAAMVSCGTLLIGAAATAPAHAAAGHVWSEGDKDRLILKNGRIIEGELVEEGADTVKFRVVVAGIAAETNYRRDDILAIERASKTDEPAKADAPAAKAAPAQAPEDAAGKKQVYVINLTGWFGTDISLTPLRQAVNDAKKHQPDYLVVVVDNAWERFEGLEQLKDEDSMFDLLFLAVKMDPILTDEIRNEWAKQPRLVFWVKKAMGGAAFLPFLSTDVYFASDAKMGGIGGVDVMFGSTGDKVVREKQVSLRLRTAEGMANKGGHYPNLPRAMCEYRYVLSFNPQTGRYYERYPEPGEILLTDDGTDESKRDSVDELVTGTGNDVLTLNANLALQLAVSKGTVNSMEDLLFELGLARNSEVVDGRSEQVLKAWRDGVANYGRTLRRLMGEFNDIQVEPPGEYNERRAARSKQINKISEILTLLDKYMECSDYMEDNGGYGPASQLAAALRLQRDRLKLEQALDKR